MPARVENPERLDLNESDWQALVLQFARLYRWRFTHFRPAMNRRGFWQTPLQGHAGFVDLVLVRDRVLFRELKTNSGRVTADQTAWLQAINAAGGDAAIWRPIDWPEVLEELQA